MRNTPATRRIGFFVIGLSAILSIGSVNPAGADTLGLLLPDGIEVRQDESTGTNIVTVRMGDDLLRIDAGARQASGAGTVFAIETGAVTADLRADGTTGIHPSSRARLGGGEVEGIVFDTRFTLDAGDRRVVVIDIGRAATAADAVVWLPDDLVLIVGRLCGWGAVDATVESDTAAWIEALEMLRDLEPTWVIPFFGEAGPGELVSGQIEYLNDLRGEVEGAIDEGLGVDEVIEAIDKPWFMAWLIKDETGVEASVTAIFDELSGRRTPWVLLEERRLREGASPTRNDPGWTPPKKVLWRNRWPERLTGLAQVAPGVEIVPFDTPEEALDLMEGADALIGTATSELVEAGADLRWVQVGSAGVERYLVVPRLGSGEVLLTNGQRLSSPVIGEHAMALTRALARGLNRAVAAQVEGEWRRSEIGDSAPLTQLRGKTMLVVGLGGIGTEVARLASGAGMRVTAIRSSRRSGPPFVAKVGLTEDLVEFVGEADVVVNCLPMTPDTDDIFDAELFGGMRKTAFFINIGRGGTVDTDALIAALEQGEIAGAGLDVTDPEPLPEDHALWGAPNLVITPHFAAWSDAGRELHWLLFRENLRRFVAGERLLSVVDPTRGY